MFVFRWCFLFLPWIESNSAILKKMNSKAGKHEIYNQNSLGQLPPVKTPPKLRFITWMHTNMHAPVACMCLSWRLISYLHCICTCFVRVSKDQTLYNSVKQYHTSFYAIANPEYLSFNEPDIFEKDCKAPPTMLSVKSETPPRVLNLKAWK